MEMTFDAGPSATDRRQTFLCPFAREIPLVGDNFFQVAKSMESNGQKAAVPS